MIMIEIKRPVLDPWSTLLSSQAESGREWQKVWQRVAESGTDQKVKLVSSYSIRLSNT